MASVYIETTIPSYLTSRPSRDLITAAHQQITHEWWDTARDRFDVFVSQAVLDEIRRGDSQYVAKRLDIVRDLIGMARKSQQLITLQGVCIRVVVVA